MKVLGENGFIEAPTRHFYSPERDRFVEYYQGEWYSSYLSEETIWNLAENLPSYPDSLREALESVYEKCWGPEGYPSSYKTTIKKEIRRLQLKLSDL